MKTEFHNIANIIKIELNHERVNTSFIFKEGKKSKYFWNKDTVEGFYCDNFWYTGRLDNNAILFSTEEIKSFNCKIVDKTVVKLAKVTFYLRDKFEKVIYFDSDEEAEIWLDEFITTHHISKELTTI